MKNEFEQALIDATLVTADHRRILRVDQKARETLRAATKLEVENWAPFADHVTGAVAVRWRAKSSTYSERLEYSVRRSTVKRYELGEKKLTIPKTAIVEAFKSKEFEAKQVISWLGKTPIYHIDIILYEEGEISAFLSFKA